MDLHRSSLQESPRTLQAHSSTCSQEPAYHAETQSDLSELSAPSSQAHSDISRASSKLLLSRSQDGESQGDVDVVPTNNLQGCVRDEKSENERRSDLENTGRAPLNSPKGSHNSLAKRPRARGFLDVSQCFIDSVQAHRPDQDSLREAAPDDSVLNGDRCPDRSTPVDAQDETPKDTTGEEGAINAFEIVPGYNNLQGGMPSRVILSDAIAKKSLDGAEASECQKCIVAVREDANII